MKETNETISSCLKKPETILPILLFLFFSFTISQVPSFHPKAQTFPLLASALGMVLTLIETVRQVRGSVQYKETERLKPLRKEFWLILGLTFLYMIGVLNVGFYVPSLFFIPLSMWIMGVRRFSTIIIATVAILAVAYLVFGYWLSIPLLARFISS